MSPEQMLKVHILGITGVLIRGQEKSFFLKKRITTEHVVRHLPKKKNALIHSVSSNHSKTLH